MREPSPRSSRFNLGPLAVLLATLLLAPGSVAAQPDAAGREPLRIGIIGAGAQGGAIGVQLAAAGHEVLFSSRNPDQLTDLVREAGPRTRAGYPGEAAEFGDVVVIAVPYGALPQVARDFGDLLRGKIVIDVGNPNVARDGPMANDAVARGVGLTTAGYLPGARVVRAFSAIGAGAVRGQAHRLGERIGIPVGGDDQQAVATVARLVDDAGFEPVIVGSLERSRVFDIGTPGYRTRGPASELRQAFGLPPRS